MTYLIRSLEDQQIQHDARRLVWVGFVLGMISGGCLGAAIGVI